MIPKAILGAIKDLTPTLAGPPVAVWHAAREGVQQAAEELPTAPGFDHVKNLVRQHPVIATCAVLAIGGFLSVRAAKAPSQPLVIEGGGV